jgi:hypothetical protein
VKKPNWFRWGSDRTKSDNLKKVRQRTDQMIKRQEAQRAAGRRTREGSEASELTEGRRFDRTGRTSLPTTPSY